MYVCAADDHMVFAGWQWLLQNNFQLILKQWWCCCFVVFYKRMVGIRSSSKIYIDFRHGQPHTRNTHVQPVGQDRFIASSGKALIAWFTLLQCYTATHCAYSAYSTAIWHHGRLWSLFQTRSAIWMVDVVKRTAHTYTRILETSWRLQA